MLVPLLVDEPGCPVLLERRTSHLPAHGGEISFPGGRVEEHDEGVEAAALREALEETGLDPARVQVVGRLPHVRTFASRHRIVPVVGVVVAGSQLTPSAEEVDELVLVPARRVLDGGAYRVISRRTRNLVVRGPALVWGSHHVWGATARILLGLRRVLSDVPGPWSRRSSAAPSGVSPGGRGGRWAVPGRP